MIKSIEFTGKFGYISEKLREPECDVRGYGMEYHYKEYTEKEKEAIEKYEKQMKVWEKHKNEYERPHLAKNLLNRKIEFSSDKINLIFGPNASGKSTILKALAGKALIEDGFTRLADTLDFTGLFEEPTKKGFLKYVNKRMYNSANIEWDGSPIYFDNFANRQSRGNLGDLAGSVLGNDLKTEVQYILGKKRSSQGQVTMWLLDKLLNIAEHNKTMEEILEPQIKKNCSDIWKTSYNIQSEYFYSFEKAKVKGQNTFMFDEIDKSLDVLNVFQLYTEVFPKFFEETGVQIILISHSPLVLSDEIRKHYNLISTDEEYTQECIKALKTLW